MNCSHVYCSDYKEGTVSEAFKRLFGLLEFDENNPFGKFICPGDIVFIKPNWVADKYRLSCEKQHTIYSTITHPKIITKTVEFVDTALQGKGKIVIGDNPSIDADFNNLINNSDLINMAKTCRTEVQLLDLRPLICCSLEDYGLKDRMCESDGDPKGIDLVDLGKESMFEGINPALFRGVFTDRRETIAAHSNGKHLYGISKSIYEADVFISLPKMKTHHKCGVTLNLKGLVGAMGKKNNLVHWRNGFPNAGGDAYPGFDEWYDDQFNHVKKRGAWPGNDTIWRMVVDLYHCFLKKKNQKRFSIVDGVVGGQGNGPFCPKPCESKILVAGDDFVEVDFITTLLMGLDPLQIKYLSHFMMSENNEKLTYLQKNKKILLEREKGARLNYEPPGKWKNLSLKE